MLALLLSGVQLVSGLQGDQRRDRRLVGAAALLRGEGRMNEGNYDKAIKYFEKLEARYPYGRYAQQAQLEIAYAYYKRQRARLGRRRVRPLHQAASQPSERRLRLLPEGPGQLQRGPRTSCAQVRGTGPDRARPEGGARIVRGVQGTRDALPGQQVHARRPRPHEVPGERARLARGPRGAVLHEARRVRRGRQPRVSTPSRPIPRRPRPKTRWR